VALPEGLELRRDHVAKAADRGEKYDASYDFLTLSYDAVFAPDEGGTVLVCPKLLNLEQVLREGEVRLDGRRVRPQFRRFRRYDLAVLPCGTRPERVEIAFDGWRGEAAVSAAERTFAGRNCLLTVSKDNPLRWIADWARFHVRAHGADAALVFDNGSMSYTPGELAEALAGAGLGVVRVAPAPQPYGPIPLRGSRSKGMFLQQALLNLARRRFLGAARAVLQCDVDELVVGRNGRSVFDAAARSRAGFVKFPGVWRTPEGAVDGMALHRDHAGVPGGRRAAREVLRGSVESFGAAILERAQSGRSFSVAAVRDGGVPLSPLPGHFDTVEGGRVAGAGGGGGGRCGGEGAFGGDPVASDGKTLRRRNFRDARVMHNLCTTHMHDFGGAGV
jgi:hypothetical protein